MSDASSYGMSLGKNAACFCFLRVVLLVSFAFGLVSQCPRSSDRSFLKKEVTQSIVKQNVSRRNVLE